MPEPNKVNATFSPFYIRASLVIAAAFLSLIAGVVIFSQMSDRSQQGKLRGGSSQSWPSTFTATETTVIDPGGTTVATEQIAVKKIDTTNLREELRWVYKRVLDREPRDEEWRNFLKADGNEQFDFAKQMTKLMESREFQKNLEHLSGSEKIHYLYHHSLGRGADPTGLDTYGKKLKLNNGVYKIYICLVESDEFISQLRKLPFAANSADVADALLTQPI